MRKLFAILLFITLFFSCTEKKEKLNSIYGNAIGTTFSIKYKSNSTVNFEANIDSLITAVNKSLSTYIPTSAISKINSGDTAIVVDDYFVEVFHKSEKIYEQTNGFFDPTIGILVNAWGFGPELSIDNLDSIKVKDLLKFVGFNKVQLKNKKVIKRYNQIYFDFNAIAKGYLVDIIGRMFEEYGIHNYLVEIGGEIRARGVNHKNTPWKIAVENPNFDGTRSFATTIELNNESIATSGNYRKYRTTPDGKKFVHTINPKTGFAKESNLLSASVISATDCADVDAYATALMAMGFEKSVAFLSKNKQLKAFLIYADDKGQIKTYTTPNLNSII